MIYITAFVKLSKTHNSRSSLNNNKKKFKRCLLNSTILCSSNTFGNNYKVIKYFERKKCRQTFISERESELLY